jgi:hypothetical protein
MEKMVFSQDELLLHLKKDSSTIETRLKVFDVFLMEYKNSALKYVVDELQLAQANQEWLINLVFIAEENDFPSELKPNLKLALLQIAKLFHESNKPRVKFPLFSAVRQIASLIEPEEVCLLLPFLKNGVIDARSVVLKSLEYVFFLAPPVDFKMVASIADRVDEIVKKFLDPDVFSAGENALLAINSLSCQATIGDTRLHENLIAAKQLDRQWLNYQFQNKFNDLLLSWKSRDINSEISYAFHNLEIALKTLI